MAIATATATFTGAEDSVVAVWSTPFAAAPSSVTAGVGVTDSATVEVDVVSITTTGCTVETSARFNGVVELIASD